MPWGKINVRVMAIEFTHVPGGLNSVKDFMMSKGYLFLGVNMEDAWFGWPELLDKPAKRQ